MNFIKSLFLSSLFFTIIFIAGCEQAPTSSIEPTDTGTQLSKVSNSAILHIWNENANNETVNIYAVNQDWVESVVTWNNRPTIFPTLESSFQTDVSNGWKTVDITGLVNKWLDGTYANYGLLLYKPADNLEVFSSKEGYYPPYLEIIYSDGSQTVLDIADTEIDQTRPDENFGGSDRLFTALINGNQKQSLIKFDVAYVPDGGCTLTPGYWKTHSSYGPAPYDMTWDLVDEDGAFFLSGKTYYQVLWTSPKGNAYYNLSFQYIAAGLNELHGADFSAAKAAYDDATTLFMAYTPAQIAGLKGSDPLRQQFINLAGILGNYNKGLIGPGHCDCDCDD